MNIKTLILLTLIILIIGCDTRPKFFQDVEKTRDEYELKWASIELGKLADSTFTDSTDLKSVLNFKTIDLKGEVTSVDMETAVRLYTSNTKSENLNLYPIFEIKNTSKVIVPVFGMGLWDKNMG